LKSTYEKLISDPKRKMEIEEEGFILDLIEELSVRMQEKKMSRADLARAMGTSRSWVTQLFKGRYENMTVRTLYKLATALDHKVKVTIKRSK